MRTIAQFERKYVKLEKAGPLDEGPPAFQVKLVVDNQQFPIADPLDKVTAKWLRNQLAKALYKIAAMEEKHAER